jgi:hypothetical protein
MVLLPLRRAYDGRNLALLCPESRRFAKRAFPLRVIGKGYVFKFDVTAFADLWLFGLRKAFTARISSMRITRLYLHGRDGNIHDFAS